MGITKIPVLGVRIGRANFGHKEVLFHLLDSFANIEYCKMATKVQRTKLLFRI